MRKKNIGNIFMGVFVKFIISRRSSVTRLKPSLSARCPAGLSLVYFVHARDGRAHRPQCRNYLSTVQRHHSVVHVLPFHDLYAQPFYLPRGSQECKAICSSSDILTRLISLLSVILISSLVIFYASLNFHLRL